MKFFETTYIRAYIYIYGVVKFSFQSEIRDNDQNYKRTHKVKPFSIFMQKGILLFASYNKSVFYTHNSLPNQ